MTSTDEQLRVSVVVPVFNPGQHIDALIDSLKTQTLAQDQFEIIFSDDGSTDDTPARLDRLAAEQTNVVVLHEANSGWPGRPRNLGMDVARGGYVFFADQDDWLGVEALARMCDFADANSSDVLVPRYAGHRRGVAKAPFVTTKPAATLNDTPLMDSLTPHKLFRTTFLRDNRIRFPEGRRRLEDHVFVTESYFLARRISVLADYHCYFHVRRDDAGNAAYQRIDPKGYYGNVREVVDIVLDHTEPGPLQDRCLRRTLRTELLTRLDGKSFLDEDPAFQRALFDEARRVAAETMPLTVDAGLSPPQRVRATLMRADRLEDMINCVSRFLDPRPTATLTDLRWNDGTLVVELDAALSDRVTAEPWRYELLDGRAVIEAPEALRARFPREAADCGMGVARASVTLVLRRRADSEEWAVPTITTVEVHRDERQTWATMSARCRVDPLTIGGGRPLSRGIWDVYARVSQTGWTKEVRLGARRVQGVSDKCRAALLADHLVLPYWTDHGNLSLEMESQPGKIIRGADRKSGSVIAREQRTPIEVLLPLVVSPTVPLEPSLHLAFGGSSREGRPRRFRLDTRAVRQRNGELLLTACTPALTPGSWIVEFALDDARRGKPAPTGLILTVPPGRAASVFAKTVRLARRAARKASTTVRRMRADKRARP